MAEGHVGLSGYASFSRVAHALRGQEVTSLLAITAVFAVGMRTPRFHHEESR